MDVQSGFAGVTDSQVREAHTWDRVIEETESAHVKRARARPPTTDLVVGADGLREIARQSLWPDAPIPGAPTTRPGASQACLAARPPWEQRTVPGLSFGLIHFSPPPFTGVRVFVFAQATDGGERR